MKKTSNFVLAIAVFLMFAVLALVIVSCFVDFRLDLRLISIAIWSIVLSFFLIAVSKVLDPGDDCGVGSKGATDGGDTVHIANITNSPANLINSDFGNNTL